MVGTVNTKAADFWPLYNAAYLKQVSGRNTSRTNSQTQQSSFVDKALSVAALISLSLLCSTGCKNEHLAQGLESRLHPPVAPAPGGEGEML